MSHPDNDLIEKIFRHKLWIGIEKRRLIQE
jgi:hypothetical protein